MGKYPAIWFGVFLGLTGLWVVVELFIALAARYSGEVWLFPLAAVVASLVTYTVWYYSDGWGAKK